MGKEKNDITFESINGLYLKGVRQTPFGVRYGLYSENQEEILSPRYASIENASEHEPRAFFVKDSDNNQTIIFIDKQRFLHRCDALFDSLRLEQVACLYPEVSGTEYTIIANKGGLQLLGSILIGDRDVFFQVPIEYRKLVRGKVYTAAFDFDGNILIYRNISCQKNGLKGVNLPLEIPGRIQNIAYGFNEPYPIVEGRICIPETNLTFDTISPTGGKGNRYCIVQNHGKFGLWREASYDGPGELLLKCEFDYITPNEETYPFPNDYQTINTFSFENHNLWGIYSGSQEKIVSPALFPTKPVTVCRISDYGDGPDTVASGFICSINGKMGVISNNTGHVIIPFEYDRIVPDGYLEHIYYLHTELFYKAFQGDKCKVFYFNGEDILHAFYSSIEIIHLQHVTTPDYAEPDQFFFICKKDDRFGLLDGKGGEVLPFEYVAIVDANRWAVRVKKNKESAFEELRIFDNPPGFSVEELFDKIERDVL